MHSVRTPLRRSATPGGAVTLGLDQLIYMAPVLVAVILTLGGTIIARPYLQGLAFIIRATDTGGFGRHFAELYTHPVAEWPLSIPLASGSLSARVYAPAHGIRRTALLIRGLHPAGYDDPRLVAFARQLAASGVAVVTPEIPELSQFLVTPGLVDVIEQAAVWLAGDEALAPDGQIGLMGLSFGGGLTLVASARPSLRGHVAYVVSIGGYHDLPRVLRYLCTGLVGDHVRPPHDYGVVVVLLSVIDRLVPCDQVAPLGAAIRRFLVASYLDDVKSPRASREFSDLRTLAATLPEPSATLLRHVNQRDVVRLGAQLLPYVGDYGNATAFSPSLSPKPTAPVFLIHGLEDNVIPADESTRIADDLSGRVPVRLLLTPLLSHAAADQPARLQDVLQLAAFWGDLLGR